MSANIGSQSLQATIEQTIIKCKDDLKRLLLLFLYSDLRLSSHLELLEDYIDQTNSRVAIEMMYIKLRHMMVTHDAKRIPASLITAFKKAFDKRQKLSNDYSSGSMVKSFNVAMKQAQVDHLVHQSGE